MVAKMDISDEEWQKKLTPEQYKVLREKGTEAPYSGKLLNNKDTGEYTCAACGTVLFTSKDKYDSDEPGLAGWPSFAEAANNKLVSLVPDDSHGMHRTEVICNTCGSHLGHLFDDPSSPSGQHYCINSAALEFLPKK
jgi:peptide-methionine (R)-S-oxide reductase